MVENISPKKFTVADLYTEAARLVREEFSAVKNKPLTPVEESKIRELSRTISRSVLKEMKIV